MIEDLPAFVFHGSEPPGVLASIAQASSATPAWATGSLWRLPQGRLVMDRQGDHLIAGVLTAPIPTRRLPVIDALMGCTHGQVRRVPIAVQRPQHPMTLAWGWITREPRRLGGRPASSPRPPGPRSTD